MEVPTFELCLEQPPNKRWNNIIDQYRDKFPQIRREVDILLTKFGYTPAMGFLISAGICVSSNNIMYHSELVTISGIMGISIDKLLLIQLLYEFNAGCTTMVSEIEGKCTMIRTMDWPLHFLKDITINLNCTFQGKIIYRATTWIGYVGIFTGYSLMDKYAVAINYRPNTTPSILDLVGRISSMCWPVGYLVRNVLEKSNFVDAVDWFRSADLISPTYITITKDINNSILLVRDPQKCINQITKLPLIQTNVDPDKHSPDILYSNKRRQICETLKGTLTDYCSQFDIFPLCNQATVYTAVIIPESGYYSTKI